MAVHAVLSEIIGAMQEQLVQLYCQCIRLVLEYACPVWHPALTAAQQTDLERVHKRVCCIILSGHSNNYSATLTTLGMENRRSQLTCSFGQKLKKIHHLQTRHSGRLPLVKC